MMHGWTKSGIVLQADTLQQKVILKPPLRAKFHSCATSPSSAHGALAAINFDTKKAFSQLGTILLELCFGKTIEEHPLRLHLFVPSNEPNMFSNISTAKAWHNDVLGRLGDDLSDAIRRCLDCSFAPKLNLEDKEFQKAVLNG